MRTTNEQRFETGPILAVLNGRFLPCESLDIEIAIDTEQIDYWNGKKRTELKDKKVLVSMETKRRPEIRKELSRLYIYTRDKRFVVSDVFGSSSYSGKRNGRWSVELRGDTIDEESR
jgi:hypothetical protein